MPAYTTPHGFPYPVSTDKIAATDENLRLALKALADKSNQKHAESMSVHEDLMGTNPIRVRETLAPEQSLEDMTSPTWNGIWTVGSANTNPGLPVTPGLVAKLLVENTTSDNYMKLIFRDNYGIYERSGQLNSWFSWVKIDRPFTYRGVVGAGTALSSLSSSSDMGIYRILENRNYPDLPPELPKGWDAGAFINFPEGFSAGLQIISLNNMVSSGKNAFMRVRSGVSGAMSPWEQLGGAGADPELANRVALLEELQGSPMTPFEANRIFSSYESGEAYMNWLARSYPEKVSLLNLGETNKGLPIRAFRLGDPSKPTLYVMASQHGDEPMGREAAYLWVRELCQDNSAETASLLQSACIIVTPVVNGDRINRTRLSSTGTDLNGNWPTESTKEITAASKVLKDYNVVLTVDAHEGGGTTQMKTALPNAPEIATSLKNVAAALNSYVASEFLAANEPYGEFPGAETMTQARNVIADRYKSATILFECPSLLAQNIYVPDVAWREGIYMLAYRSVFKHFRDNLQAYVVAKNDAG